MVKVKKESKNPENPIKFGLLIRRIQTPQGIMFNIEAQNQGIPDPEVILIVEAWLQQVKEKFQKPIRDGLLFGGSPPPDIGKDDEET